MLEKLVQIKEGWGNFIFEDPLVEKEALRRAAICAGCDSAVPSKLAGAIFGKKDTLPTKRLICKECKCPLSVKSRSMSSACDLGKWETFKPNHKNHENHPGESKS